MSVNQCVCFLTLLSYSFVLQAKDTWIRGLVSNYSKANYSNKVYLSQADYLNTFNLIDSAIIDSKGSFSFKNTRNWQVDLYQIFVQGGTPISIMLNGKEEIKIITDAAGLFYGEAKVSGSLENDIYVQLENIQQHNEDIKKTFGETYNQVDFFDPKYTTKTNLIHDSMIQALSASNLKIDSACLLSKGTFCANVLSRLYINFLKTDVKKLDTLYDNSLAFQHNHYFDKMQLDDSRIAHFPIFYTRINEYMADYINNSSTDGFKNGIDKIMSYIRNDELKAVVALHLGKEFKKQGRHEITDYLVETYYAHGCEITSSEDIDKVVTTLRAASLGSIAPEIILPNANENQVKLSSTRGKKAVIVYFWSSHCQYCLQSLPIIKKYYDSKTSKGLEVYAVSLDNDRETWASFLSTMNLKWVNVCDGTGTNSPTANLYGIRGTPTYILLDNTMKVILRTHDLNELLNRVDTMLQ